MTEPTNPQEPVPDEGPTQEQTQAQPPVPPQAPVATAPQTRFRDRVLGMRGVAAVAVAGLIIGGAGGAVLGAVTSDDDRDGGRFGGPGGFGGPGHFQQQMPPGQFPEQGGPGQGFPGGGMPPGTAPQDDVQPDNSGYTTSGTNT